MFSEIEVLLEKIDKEATIQINHAVNQLSQYGVRDLLLAVSQFMNKPSISRKMWIVCIQVLCKIDTPEAIELLVQSLNTDNDDHRFRLVELFSLSRCGRVEAVPTLIRLLKEDTVTEIRLMAAFSLGVIGDKRALPNLKWAAENDHERDYEDVPVSLVAKEAIAKITGTFHE